VKDGKPQAKDVPILPILRAIAAVAPEWVMIWDLAEIPELAPFPDKVVRAKLNALIGLGLVTGCTCGCRGDFEITDKGRRGIEVLSK
jgi:hypothetical protein